MVKTIDEIKDFVKGSRKKRIVVAVAQDEDVLRSVHDAHHLGLVDVSLVGDKKKIYDIASELKIDVSGYEIVKEIDEAKAIRIAVDMAANGSADMLMKGMIQTADLFKAVLDKDHGLRTNRILSHVGIFEVANYHKLLFVTDAGINISPDLKQKADIIQNAVDVATSLEIEKPKVAVLAAIELVNPSMQATLEAAALSKMADRGQIKNCIVDGPLAMDNAISLEAAKHKGIQSIVAGDADILLMPDIEAGNILVKSLSFLGQAKSCGIVAGARVPIVVTSRADDHMTKLNSIALASIMSIKNKSL
ncbi:MAG: phosphate butyryltransferase [Clostridia bacterium]|nr:phosphate butyryltransferase [Clostridia bacterium]